MDDDVELVHDPHLEADPPVDPDAQPKRVKAAKSDWVEPVEGQKPRRPRKR